jgi:hypothetical protein
MFAYMKENQMGHWQAQAFSNLPQPEVTPCKAFIKLQSGDVEPLPI